MAECSLYVRVSEYRLSSAGCKANVLAVLGKGLNLSYGGISVQYNQRVL